MMEVVGARGRVGPVSDFLARVQAMADRYHIVIQVFDADLVFGRLHLVSAFDHAVRAIQQGTNTTGSLGLEALLYASGEYQIQKALAKMGVKPETTHVAVLFFSERGAKMDSIVFDFLHEIGFYRDDTVLEGDRETLCRFGVSDAEIATVKPDQYGDLILERVAMVDVFKR